MESKEEFDKSLYTIAVIKYKKLHPEIDRLQLFSRKWELSENYYIKNNILAEAIEKNILVEETQLYNEYFK